MAQVLTKYLKFNGTTPVLVDYAKHDGEGFVISATYLKKSDYEAYVLPIASDTVLGGIKVGNGLEIDSNGILSATQGGTADNVAWSGVIGRPFNSAKTEDFIITGDSDATKILAINPTNWVSTATLTSELADKVDVSTLNQYIETTAPATYVAISNFKTTYLDGNNVAYKSEIPKKVSDLNNDIGFITANVSNLANYPTTTTVNNMITTLKKNNYQVVATKPATGEEGITYLVGNDTPYEMWIYETVEGWIDLGSTTMDLTGYVQGTGLTDNQILLGSGNSNVKTSGKTVATTLGSDDSTVPTSKAVADRLANYLLSTTASSTYATKVELGSKQDAISLKSGEAIVTFSGNQIGSNLIVTDVTIGS